MPLSGYPNQPDSSSMWLPSVGALGVSEERPSRIEFGCTARAFYESIWAAKHVIMLGILTVSACSFPTLKPRELNRGHVRRAQRRSIKIDTWTTAWRRRILLLSTW